MPFHPRRDTKASGRATFVCTLKTSMKAFRNIKVGINLKSTKYGNLRSVFIFSESLWSGCYRCAKEKASM